MKYRESGVNIDAAQAALARAKAAVRSTWDRRVRSDLGTFGGLFSPAPGEPLLVASIDGVGTKVKIAALMGRYDTVGQDLVNHCVNDILVQGAEPLFFLDYFATGRLEQGALEGVLAGVALACRENGCALLGGETAEMPGLYAVGDFDLAGCIVGRVAESDLIDGTAIRAGDRIWGLPSTGLHTNGYSLARRIVFDEGGHGAADVLPPLTEPIGEALMAVHRSYLPHVRALWTAFGRQAVHGLAHITGGGFTDNVPRVIPDGLCARIDTRAWTPPALFRLLGDLGQVGREEMYRVFNMGLGMVVFLPPQLEAGSLPDLGAVPIGEVAPGAQKVALHF